MSATIRSGVEPTANSSHVITFSDGQTTVRNSLAVSYARVNGLLSKWVGLHGPKHPFLSFLRQGAVLLRPLPLFRFDRDAMANQQTIHTGPP